MAYISLWFYKCTGKGALGVRPCAGHPRDTSQGAGLVVPPSDTTPGSLLTAPSQNPAPGRGWPDHILTEPFSSTSTR